MCDDCQTYAHYLGRSEEILDAHGGTEIFQMRPSQLRLTEGTDNLRCVRLSPKGLMRWYAGCCKTPVGNTLSSAKVPFVGVFHLFMHHEDGGPSRDEILGPLRGKVQGRFSRGEMPADAHRTAPAGLILRAGWFLLGGWIRGQQRPSPFFDAAGRCVVEPTILTLEERERLRQNAFAQSSSR